MNKNIKIGEHTLGEIIEAQECINQALGYIHEHIATADDNEKDSIIAAFTLLFVTKPFTDQMFKHTAELVVKRLEGEMKKKVENLPDADLSGMPISSYKN